MPSGTVPLIELLLYLLRNIFLYIVLLKGLINPQKSKGFTTQHSKQKQTQKQNPKGWTMQPRKWKRRKLLKLTATAISTASFCMSGIMSALLMMTFLGGTAGAGKGNGFRSSVLGLAVRGPAMPFLASSLIFFLSLSSNQLWLAFRGSDGIRWRDFLKPYPNNIYIYIIKKSLFCLITFLYFWHFELSLDLLCL